MKKIPRLAQLIGIFFLTLLSVLILHWGTPSLEAAPVKKPSTSPEQLALYYYWQGQYQKAISLWETLLTSSSPNQAAEIHRYLGVAYQDRGQMGRAISHFQQAAQFEQDRPTAKEQFVEVLISLAQTLNELGQGDRAIESWHQAIALIEEKELRQLETTAYQGLGTAYLLTQDFDQAIAAYQRSRDLAGIHGQTERQVEALNHLTHALTKRKKRWQASAAAAANEGKVSEENRLLFLAEQDEKMALETASRALKISQTQINLSTVRAMINLTQLDPQQDYRHQAKQIVQQLRPSRTQAHLLISLAQLESTTSPLGTVSSGAVELLEKAIKVAEKLGDWRTLSYGLGQLGYVYEQGENYDLALSKTEAAQGAAQHVMAADSLYRWQWQAGRIYQATNRPQKAQAAYRGAIATLQKLREEISHASPELQVDVKDEVEPVYREFLSLLLEGQPDRTALTEAIAVTNQLQLTELQSFFGDPCLELRQAQLNIEAYLPEGTGRIHSLILPNSTQIILELPDGKIAAYPIAIEAQQMRDTIEQWRFQLESSRIPLGYRDLSERLYDLLIRPMEKNLVNAQIKKLIFVNDGLLRNVPMAALHDGQRFLIEKSAISYSLGINVSFGEPTTTEHRASIFGLSVPVADFPPLPYVENETEQVLDTLGGERFLNEAFTVSNLEKQIRNNNAVLHLATHGEFGGTAKTTFLQTFERPIFLGEFEQILSQRTEAIELLTLSACQTAVGNQRAVLGLAGVALRSGVKSVLATLWSVRDNEVVAAISKFYRYWQQGLSQEEAYQKALVELIHQPQSHPQNWSALVLISHH